MGNCILIEPYQSNEAEGYILLRAFFLEIHLYFEIVHIAV